MRFQEQLDSAIARWNSGDVDDEWLFQRLREDEIGRMAPEEAWVQIGESVTKLLNEENETTATELVETIIALRCRVRRKRCQRKLRHRAIGS